MQHSRTGGGSAGAVVAGLGTRAAASYRTAPNAVTAALFTVSLAPELGRPFRALDAVGVQHLQQQVVKRHAVLTLHAVQMLHPFVAAERVERNNPSRSISPLAGVVYTLS